MSRKPTGKLRRGWTTGACATAATKAALQALFSGEFPQAVSLVLPKGETPRFKLAHEDAGPGWAEVGITKDAGDDPDVTHGALIVARVARSANGVVFCAGHGVGTVTKAGLPIDVGEAAINPVPRQMMAAVVAEQCDHFGEPGNIEITISVPGGQALAQKTWNPRLGIVGGISILGTTGVVRPFSCSAWIASIHRGIDVARAGDEPRVAGCTGATSEATVQALFDLPDHAMLDMGDFAGGMLKYLRKNPLPRLTIGGGFGKITKLSQGAFDLHSARSQVDFAALNTVAQSLGLADVADANSALEAVTRAGPKLAHAVARGAKEAVGSFLADTDIAVDIVIVDRNGAVIARTDQP